MRYVLDTNVVSSLMKGEPNVIERLKRVARADVRMPQPVVAEIAYGNRRHMTRVPGLEVEDWSQV